MSNLVSVRNVSIFGVSLAVLAFAAVLLVGQFSSTASAKDDKDELKDFKGLWMGVDPSDGGFMNLSITDNNGDKEAELNLSETFVTSCANNRGSITGSGSVADDGDMDALLTIQCLTIDDPDDPEFPGPVIGPIPVVFEAMEKNHIVFNVPVIPDFVPRDLHKVSR